MTKIIVPPSEYRYLDRSFSTADTELGRAFAIVAVTKHTRLRSGPHATREDVVDALTFEGVPLSSTDLVDQILLFVNNRYPTPA
jgi:hypothetical protein